MFWTQRRQREGRRLRRVIRTASWNMQCGCAYIPDLLPEESFRDVVQEYQSLRDRLADEGPCVARGRRVIAISEGSGSGSAAWRLFQSYWLRLRIQREARLRFLPLLPKVSDCPLEYREYREGSSMLWHKDTVLTEPPQLELVYTLENTSDSVTRWATSHLDVLNCRVQEVWTAPNSALLVQAGGPVHMVRELKTGHRVILKAVLLPKPIGSGPLYAAPTARWKENLTRCKAFRMGSRPTEMSPA